MSATPPPPPGAGRNAAPPQPPTTAPASVQTQTPPNGAPAWGADGAPRSPGAGQDDQRRQAAGSPLAKERSSTDDAWARTKRKVHDIIVAEIGPLLSRDGSIDLASEVTNRLDNAMAQAGVSITAAQKRRFVKEITADILGYGPLEPLLSDPDVTEVMVNGPNDIYVERAGGLSLSDSRFRDEAHLRAVINKIVSAVGRRVDEASPMVDARLPDGSRVNVILPPLSLKGPIVTIRKFPEDPLLIDDLVQMGSLSAQLSAFLSACVHAKLNILISGGTGTGKTTMLNALSQFIPSGDRIVTIEDAAELQLKQPHVIPLESRPANTEGTGLITIRDLVKNSLRMRPDRIVVGECRGSEALDMLQAMNTGHEGSLTTVHANTPRDALSRLETMVLMAGFDLTLRAIRDQVASALDLIVQIDRLGDGRRVVAQVTEVQGTEGDVIVLQDLFKYEFTAGGKETSSSEGRLIPTGLRPKVLNKILAAGIELAPGTFINPHGVLGTGGGKS